MDERRVYQILLKSSNVQARHGFWSLDIYKSDLEKIEQVNRFGDGFPNFLHFPNLLTQP